MPYSNHLLNVLSEITSSDLKRQIEFLKVEREGEKGTVPFFEGQLNLR